MRVLQVTVLLACLGAFPAAAQVLEAKAFEFTPPAVSVGRFGDQVGMLPKERDDYATNLATFAGNLVIEKKASAPSLDTAKRLLAVALHMSPRNRHALVVGFQLKKGVLPKEKKADYSSSTLSRLLLSRSRVLAAEDDAEGKLLARCLVEISATIDPRNEDAVFEFEIQRLDTGDVDWEALYVAPKKEEKVGEP
jgi:hypothetical protein